MSIDDMGLDEVEVALRRCLYKINHRNEERPDWLARERRRLLKLVKRRFVLERKGVAA